MTHPPSAPSGRPGPDSPPGGRGPYAQPGPYGGRQQTPPSPPEQPFDPWGRAPGAFESYGGGSLEGPVSGPPKKTRSGLVAGIVAAVVVLAGGGVTALLLLTRSDGDGTAATAGAPAPTGEATPASNPATLAKAAVESLNSRSATRYATLMCAAPSQTALADVQKEWTEASDAHGSVTGSPEITGTTASVDVTVTYNGNTESTKILMTQQGQKWCIDES